METGDTGRCGYEISFVLANTLHKVAGYSAHAMRLLSRDAVICVATTKYVTVQPRKDEEKIFAQMTLGFPSSIVRRQ